MSSATSPVSVATAQRIEAYNAKVFARYARAARKLPWRVASANKGTGHGSIFGTLVHILNVHEVWMLYIAQGRTRELNQLFDQSDRRPKSWEGFNAYSSKVWTGIRHYMDSITSAQLGKRVKAPWMPGHYTIGDAILQTTFEQAHHLGEIIGIYWQRDEEPPEMTWIDVNRSPSR